MPAEEFSVFNILPIEAVRLALLAVDTLPVGPEKLQQKLCFSIWEPGVGAEQKVEHMINSFHICLQEGATLSYEHLGNLLENRIVLCSCNSFSQYICGELGKKTIHICIFASIQELREKIRKCSGHSRISSALLSCNVL